jgi:hypothetical protein
LTLIHFPLVAFSSTSNAFFNFFYLENSNSRKYEIIITSFVMENVIII